MNVKIILLCLTYCFAAAICMSVLDTIEYRWKDYKEYFNKKYDYDEDKRREEIFKKRVKYIERHNQRYDKNEVSFKLNISQFSDWTDQEISEMRSNIPYDDDDNLMESDYEQTKVLDEIPSHHDWRKANAVSGIKNLRECFKSDYAFATVGALEGQLFQKNGKLTNLSEQELIDCSTKFGNNGCIGGEVHKAIEYVKTNGLSMEESYPFNGNYNEICPRNRTPEGITKGTQIAFKYFHVGWERNMRHFVFYNGSIAAQIYASPNFCHYSGGIFTDEDCVKNQTNYNILIVGYGITNKSEEYWIVKNWWGETWGEKGYAKIAFNKSTCGIDSRAAQIYFKSKTNE